MDAGSLTAHVQNWTIASVLERVLFRRLQGAKQTSPSVPKATRMTLSRHAERCPRRGLTCLPLLLALAPLRSRLRGNFLPPGYGTSIHPVVVLGARIPPTQSRRVASRLYTAMACLSSS
jgi:hypothetical protein